MRVFSFPWTSVPTSSVTGGGGTQAALEFVLTLYSGNAIAPENLATLQYHTS